MRKRILFITHQLSKTGAPIVFLDMIRFCKKRGHEVVVISMEEGELRSVVEEMQIPILVRKSFLPDYEVFLEQVKLFDIVVANTLITFEAIHVLKYANVPVIWWLHEGRQYFEYFKEALPDFHKLPKHIYVYAVSPYVKNALYELYRYQAPLLPIGVEDVFQSGIKKTGEVLKFVVSGTYSKIKGQDILVEAIRRLPQKNMGNFQVEFYGNLQMRDEDVFQKVHDLSEQYPNISVMPFVSHQQMLEKIAEADCLIIPSRIDPLPTVAIEAMMQHVPCICSDVCGIATYMKDGVNGIVFQSENVDALTEKMIYALENREALAQIGTEARNIYDSYFSAEAFEANVEKIFSTCIS